MTPLESNWHTVNGSTSRKRVITVCTQFFYTSNNMSPSLLSYGLAVWHVRYVSVIIMTVLLTRIGEWLVRNGTWFLVVIEKLSKTQEIMKSAINSFKRAFSIFSIALFVSFSWTTSGYELAVMKLDIFKILQLPIQQRKRRKQQSEQCLSEIGCQTLDYCLKVWLIMVRGPLCSSKLF